ncbi:MAG: glycogen synthase GlgA [Candidatus Omnitrophica bacterium]|nr:glycogen synthase GlgA [Candidatus Omnitrophota bacterium]MDD5488252.1 glycogen synthase GlgA [Candidatus Omnitrophota bacterium]
MARTKTTTTQKRNTKKILFVSSEAVPFVKTGGLADVSGALPKALAKEGHDIRLVLPRYWSIDVARPGFEKILSPMGVRLGDRTAWCEVFETKMDGVTIYFIEHQNFFGRSGLYDDGRWEYPDNAERFGFFSKACLQLCRDLGFQPDIIHCNDWQTSLIPAYLKIWYLNDPFFSRTASVLSIHNIGYQGVFPSGCYEFLGLGKENFTEPKLESHGRVHFMKGGIFYADAISTVSPSYAEEILTPEGGMGLTPYLERRRDDVLGVLNGADYDHWDPGKDTFIPSRYSASSLSGKQKCKEALQKEMLLAADPSIPVIGVISRLVAQKGFQLLVPVIESIVRDMRVQFAILGAGEKWMEDFFGGLPAKYPGKIGAWIGYSDPKAHLIEAGSDFFLMPSLYEPCGLNQIYSMRYGTLPIVREIGGLKDTVRQYDESAGTGTGFRFTDPDPMALYYAIGWAISTFYDRPRHIENMIKEAMRADFSWKESAIHYLTLYEKAIARRASWK